MKRREARGVRREGQRQDGSAAVGKFDLTPKLFLRFGRLSLPASHLPQ